MSLIMSTITFVLVTVFSQERFGEYHSHKRLPGRTMFLCRNLKATKWDSLSTCQMEMATFSPFVLRTA